MSKATNTCPISTSEKDPCNWDVAEVRHCSKGNCAVEISYQTFGDSSDPAVLLVMGLGGQGVIWGEGFCQKIAQAGFYAIRFDNRDVGYSTKFDHMKCSPMWHLLMPECMMSWKPVYTLVDMAEDAVCLLKKLGVQKAHWMGVSMGGMICQEAAINFPEHVASMTSIMSTTGNKKLPDPAFKTKLWFLKTPKTNKYEDVITHKVAFAKAVLCTGVEVTDEVERFLEEEAKIQLNRSTYDEGMTRQLFAVRTAACRDAALAKIQMPTMVLHGKKDVLVLPKHGEHTAAAIAKDRTPGEAANHKGLKVLNKMAHHIGPWCYDEVLDELIPFFKHVGAASVSGVSLAAVEAICPFVRIETGEVDPRVVSAEPAAPTE